MAVDSTHYEYDKYYPQWEKLRDTVAGQEAIHYKRKKYLPQLSGQTRDEYNAYLHRALFYGAMGRTVDGLTGMLFRKPPMMEMGTTLEEYAEDITLDGTSLLGFAEDLADEIVQIGRAGILVDHPSTADMQDIITIAEAERANLRPFLKMYVAEAICYWERTFVNNKKVLSQLRLKEKVKVEAEEFESEYVEQIRVLDLFNGVYRQRLYRKDDKKMEWVQFGGDVFPMVNSQTLDFIPFYFVGPRNNRPEVQKPPLIDLANANISHYKTTADLEHGAHFTALPTAVITGLNEETDSSYRIGSAAAWVFPNPDTKAEYLEFKGSGLESLEKRAAAKEQYMAFLGARMLAPDKRAAETAETAQIHRQGENSVLSSIAYSISDVLMMAIETLLFWAGRPDEEFVFKLNTDFMPAIMSAQDIQAVMQLWQSGGIAFDDLLYNLKRGEIVHEKRTSDEIRSEVEEDDPFQGQDLTGGE